uniref:Uncharacterized protein n=1 Tax=Rhizophagus irregularis (strain DAOM 181602 / DAOM 197198 / MUCL 43194) TaxID=747089 RepID=U9SL65_RHIID
MFFLESFHFKKTEPKFFSILRLLIAVVFSCVLVYYGWNSFSEFISEINTKKLITISYPEFEICSRTLNNDNKTMKEFYPNMINDLYNNNSIPRSTEFFTNVTNSCMKFTPDNENVNHKFNKKLLFVLDLDNSTIYDYFEISFKSFTKITMYNDIIEMKLILNQYFITPGQYHVYDFYYKSMKYYSSYLTGFLGFDAGRDRMDIVIKEKILAQIPNAFTVLELSQKYKFVVDDDIMTFKNDANRYVSRGGIPLVEDPRKLPPDGKIEDRVAVLEILLKEYYIDSDYLNELGKTRKRYEKHLNIRNENLELLGDKNDDDYNDDNNIV